ncbi:MAG: cob(I)yrinic acid a,c-diamide adenosyltransferase [Deltaproteobacteria bacterium]|nr:cob(I)yrinic acid a,c-diamide adenosyltransferase [Deltaproteobacteria bacterium]
MKIYTKTGDKGTTALANGKRVPKSSLHIEAYGTVDELNAHTALLCDLLGGEAGKAPSLCKALSRVQNELFTLGAQLAAFQSSDFAGISEAAVKQLEGEIDRFSEQVPALKHFVLPGGHVANSQAHVCRCVCRRAERLVCKLAESESLSPQCVIYLNRLSDWFFTISREISRLFNVEEKLW